LYRRHFLSTAAAAALAGCSRSSAPGYSGVAFVANQEGKAVAVVDLRNFALVRHIALQNAPQLVITHPGHSSVFAAAGNQLVEIDAARLEAVGTINLPGAATELAYSADGNTLYALVPGARALAGIDLARGNALHTIPLGAEPGRMTLSREGKWAAVSLPGKGEVALVDLASRKIAARAETGGVPFTVRFRGDSRLLVTGDRANHTAVMVSLDGDSAALQPQVAVRIPLGLEPLQLREKADGGQMFFTGAGADTVVTLYPYSTEVGSTTLAGHLPSAMALSETLPYLFVTNPTSATVTIINLASQKVVAAVGVGRDPIHIAVTPDNEYALVLNHTSGDMSVLHIPTLAGGRTKSAALFNQVPVGSGPVSCAVRLG
jgi:YVTN family beta-propeller protein